MGNCFSQSLNNIENSSPITCLKEIKKQNILGFSRELLYYCSLKKKAEIIELIQSFDFKDCNINFQDGNGWSPLLQVCQSIYGIINENDTQEIIKIFISRGADVNLSNCMKWTPLMFSVKNNDYKSVKLLIENGAKIDCQNAIGYTSIMYSTINNNDKVLVLLLANLSHHASFMDTCYDKTIWDYVVKNSKCEDILKMYARKCVKDITKNENKYLCKDVLLITCEYLGFKY
jgi:ankyrin repeat protein|tara:strand:- start:40 stop:732 length:693 start_codon:yes stop_codon:yes gene_type:complete